MVRTSGIRDKLRSDVLKDLAKERASKKFKSDDSKAKSINGTDNEGDNDSDSEANLTRLDIDRKIEESRDSRRTNSLLSLLPKPKNSSSFGPTVRLEKLLAESNHIEDDQPTIDREPIARPGPDGMIEVDVSKEVCDTVPDVVKDLTVERPKPGAIVLPKGKERQKNQITYLAQLGKATELEQKEKASQSRMNKAAARSKYGW